jgi:hypothetical protein
MKLIDDVVDAATASDVVISTLLRKFLVLAYELKNDRLKEWVDKELNGYNRDDELPPYRQIRAMAKGFFIGPGGMQLHDQPLPAAILAEKYRHFATSAMLRGPIAAYDTGAPFIIQWPPDLTAEYQEKFLDHLTLNRAWQEIPNMAIVALIDTVRNRVLRFALDLREELGSVHDNPASLPAGKVDQYVTNYIFGGKNIISPAAHDFTQIGEIKVGQGDIAGLFTALAKIGVKGEDFSELKDALERDAAKPAQGARRGQRTSTWLKTIGQKLTDAGMNIGVDTAKAAAARAISQYLGLS